MVKKPSPRDNKLEWRWYLKVLRTFPGCVDMERTPVDTKWKANDAG